MSAPEVEELSPAEQRAHERAIILGLQTLMLAERNYAAANGGLFGPLPCLAEPWNCLAGFPRDGVSFVDPTHDWLKTHLGYVREFHPGPPASPDELRKAKAAPGSLKSWAYTANPLRPDKTGLIGLCADAKGQLCMTADGTEPPVKNGLCSPCKKLQ